MNIYLNDNSYRNVKVTTIDRIGKDILIKIEPKSEQEKFIKIKENNLMIITFENS